MRLVTLPLGYSAYKLNKFKRTLSLFKATLHIFLSVKFLLSQRYKSPVLHLYFCAFVLHLEGVCLQEPVSAPVLVLLRCTWKVSVYKSLFCTRICAIVLHLEGVCLQEPMLHVHARGRICL